MSVFNSTVLLFKIYCFYLWIFFFFSSRRRHTRSLCDWSSDVCSSDLRTVMDFMELYVHERWDGVIVKGGWRVVLCLERFITAKERPALVIEMLCRGVDDAGWALSGVGPGTQAPTGESQLVT